MTDMKLLNRQRKRQRQKYRIREFIRAYLHDHPCRRCGATTCLTFHHIDPTTKIKTIAALKHSRSLTKLKAEMAKCEVLCRTCHEILHGFKKNLEE